MIYQLHWYNPSNTHPCRPRHYLCLLALRKYGCCSCVSPSSNAFVCKPSLAVSDLFFFLLASISSPFFIFFFSPVSLHLRVSVRSAELQINMGTRKHLFIRCRGRWFIYYNQFDNYLECLGDAIVNRIPTDPEEYRSKFRETL